MLLDHEFTGSVNNMAIAQHHEDLEKSPSVPSSQTEINRFFRQHDQRTCHMGTYTALISAQGCTKIKRLVKKYLRNKSAFRCSTDIMYNAIINYSEFCPKCRYYKSNRRG
jgi:lipopolysaccharide biosynthesis regulator YciM